MRRPHLFRWHQHWQWDVPFGRGWLSLGASWRSGRIQPVAYWSPDATPSNPLARGWSAR